MKPARLARAAARELAEAAQWYESRQPGLAARFLAEVDRGLASLRARPSAYPVLLDSPPDLEIRRLLLARFPYALIFLELESDFRVIAVAHTRRQPGYWLDRMRP